MENTAFRCGTSTSLRLVIAPQAKKMMERTAIAAVAVRVRRLMRRLRSRKTASAVGGGRCGTIAHLNEASEVAHEIAVALALHPGRGGDTHLERGECRAGCAAGSGGLRLRRRRSAHRHRRRRPYLPRGGRAVWHGAAVPGHADQAAERGVRLGGRLQL